MPVALHRAIPLAAFANLKLSRETNAIALPSPGIQPMTSLQDDLAASLAEKLRQASAEMQLRPIRIFDVGVFPWHESLELSFFCEGDEDDEKSGGDRAYEDDVASWPLYNFSAMEEGEWQSAEPICAVLSTQWESQEPNLVPMLQLVVQALKSEPVQQALSQLPQAADFRIQVLDPDDPESPNYYES